MRQHILEQTPGQEAMTNRVQRVVDGIRQDVQGLSAADIAFVAVDASWVSPSPTNLQDAINRLAAAGGVTPVP